MKTDPALLVRNILEERIRFVGRRTLLLNDPVAIK
jgi:hypothetical protein